MLLLSDLLCQVGVWFSMGLVLKHSSPVLKCIVYIVSVKSLDTPSNSVFFYLFLLDGKH